MFYFPHQKTKSYEKVIFYTFSSETPRLTSRLDSYVQFQEKSWLNHLQQCSRVAPRNHTNVLFFFEGYKKNYTFSSILCLKRNYFFYQSRFWIKRCIKFKILYYPLHYLINSSSITYQKFICLFCPLILFPKNYCLYSKQFHIKLSRTYLMLVHKQYRWKLV